MSIVEKLVTAFPDAAHAASVDDAFILANPSIMEIPRALDLLQVVPAYMLWCAKNPDAPALVSDRTLQALAEYGRCKDPENTYLNFRYLCAQSQVEAVSAFLEWAHETLPFLHEEQLDRARRNWTGSSNNSSKRTR